MKYLPLAQLHREQGAKFGPFAGYEMPLFYPDGIIREHKHTRESASLFDISHMAPVMITGPGAAALIEALCPYPASAQEEGRSRYTFFLNEQAGIIDDLIVSRLGPQRFQIVCNAACAEKDLAHIRHHAPHFDVDIDAGERAMLALQGPQAESVMRNLGMDVAAMRFLDARETEPGWFIGRGGYTGEDGFEIILPPAEAEGLARKLLGDERVRLAGLGARDSLRLEAGLPLYGQDLNADTTPMEAGLTWAIPKSHREGGDFVGAVALAQKIKAGPARKRIGLKPQGSAPVRAHAPLHDASGEKVGEVTSGGFGPTVGHPIAMGLVAVDFSAPLSAEIRGRQAAMDLADLPFVPHRYRK